MAQMLQEKFSSEKHLDFSERHARLCNRNPGAAFLIPDIQSVIKGLQNVVDAKKAKEKEQSYAYDAVVFCDGGLDNEIYNTFEACKKYDRESGTVPIMASVFPTGRLSDIKDAPVMQEPGYAKELLERIKVLGSTHPVAANIPSLEAKITASENAITAYDTLGNEVALLSVQEEIAQRKLRDQYQLNYLHAMEKLGKSNAEMLFPTISKGPRNGGSSNDTPTPPAS
jgi:hypothetical protein